MARRVIDDDDDVLPELAPLVLAYKAAVEADRIATQRLNESRRTLIEYLKANGLEKLFTV